MDAQGDLFFAVGEYMPPADRLKQIRTAIAEHGPDLVKVLKNKKLQQTFGDLQEEDKLQRPPKGFDAGHAQIELIKLKHFMVWDQVAMKGFEADRQSETVLKTLAGNFKNAYPLVCWLRATR